MSFRYRQPLKCKYPKSVMLCLHTSALWCYRKMEARRALPCLRHDHRRSREGQRAQGKGPRRALCISLHSHSPLHLTPSQINHKGGVWLDGWKGTFLTFPALPCQLFLPHPSEYCCLLTNGCYHNYLIIMKDFEPED